MSSIVPGPQKKLEEEISAARSGAKPLSAGDLNPSAPKQEQLAGLDDWPPDVRAVVEADYDRVTALATNRRKTADLALPAVVSGLDVLLDQLAERIQADRPRRLRKSTTPADVPLDDVAELLGIPADELTPTPGRAEHRTAVRTIKQLRAQLKESPDHSRLTRLVTFVVRLALVTESLPEATARLAPVALDRYIQAMPDPQWDWTFAQKLEFWKQTRQTLTDHA
ncbi:hypothetical protein [Kribbella sp. CA-247076]|uniref:hypothetical protein n=1 Tax=Kribbella sp. CA-247076 TaxID=3239941 RepID=UPI003D8B9B58